ncbi:class I SAM-dependent methyltransferase [Catellatospora tritici]|uniref:class I SAM-dependent methyltransferase n=1 Tax=Catellatospora tritici TaxID=2851566 RepID=UPI001C2D78AE|nr:methyltransferase domain-containing protein [Catellatospora tritici]MBV1854545.1 methyltransferase domain-containing protein [Catellatospora tritici]
METDDATLAQVALDGWEDLAGLDVLVGQLLEAPTSTHGLRRALRGLRREIGVFQAHRAGCEDLPERITARRVQLGGGSRLLPGFVNIDIIPPADVIFDVREGLPIVDGETEFIFAEHFLEHIDYPVSVKRVIAECYRVLQPDGQLVLGVPDAGMIIDAYVDSDPDIRERMMEEWYANRDDRAHFNTYLDLVNYVFRDQDDSDRYTPHLWAYDLDKLVSLCAEAGFRKVEPWPHDPTIANPDRAWGSVYTVAYK